MANNKDIAGLKILADTIPASLIKIVLKYRKDSISKIKKDIEDGNYVLSCSFVGEPQKFNNLMKCYNELIKAGFNAELYDCGRKSSAEYFSNWSNTMKEIREEIDNEDIYDEANDNGDDPLYHA